MFKFNDTNILTGYIKELMAGFYLPKYKIYTKENADYFNTYGQELNIIESSNLTDYKDLKTKHPRLISYIKDNKIQQYTTEKGKHYWKTISPSYAYNRYIPNEVRNFQIKNNIYDYYTHEYLGDYLRFFRDYHNIDLMPLYNCFSNRICSNIELAITIYNNNNNTLETTFSGSDEQYKIYMLPVKLFKEYTIAIDCAQKVEFCCGVYNKYLNTADKFSSIPAVTYMSTSCTFNQPFLFTALADKLPNMLENDEALELAQNEADLKLFIKLPANNNSSITVLEGNYLDYQGKLILDKAAIEDPEFKLKPITKLQLLNMNTQESYPFADRLIEYLLGNVVTPLDQNEDNVKRIQKVLSDADSSIPIDGLWTEKLRKLLYAKTNIEAEKSGKQDDNHDILGYMDKDVENIVKSKSETLLNVDLYKNERNIVIEEAR